MSGFHHVPIMLGECLQGLAIRPDGIYVDGTVGGAGHAEAVLERLPQGRLYGFDLDEAALHASRERLARFGGRFQAVHGNFKDAPQKLREMGVEHVDGVLLDLGVSSHQLDEAQRGFSYSQDAPLDMRMDQSAPLSAYEVINAYDEARLRQILWDYGEERYAPRIAAAIVRARANKPIERTGALSDIITAAIPAKFRRTGPHPAKRSFQSVRIEVNSELSGLGPALENFIDFLGDRGRLCVISFHSLEDRIVKNTMRQAQDPCTCPKDFPQCVCGKLPKGRVVTRKPLLPSQDELEVNPRARSAKLRIFQREYTQR